VDELEKNHIIPKGYLEKFWLDFGVEQYHISKGVSPLIAGMIRILIEQTSSVINKNGIDSLEKVRAFNQNPEGKNKILTFGPYEEKFRELKKFVYKYIYGSPVVTIMDVKAVRIVKNIFHTYKRNPEQLPYPIYMEYIKAKDSAEQMSDGYTNSPARIICDYMASMTDRSAIEEYDRLFDPHSKIYRGTGV
jgi:dGTPase